MEKEVLNFVPFDKSWIIRMGVLDLLNGKKDAEEFLKKQKLLNDDLLHLLTALQNWNTKKIIDVGESGTLLRFLQFISWKYKLDKEFVRKGTLATRKINDRKEIVNWPLKELLKLDGETSQWASASVLCGNKEIIENAPFKLKVTYEAVEHWNENSAKGKVWQARRDQTIQRQAETFISILENKEVKFTPKQAEDYCFARAFGFITKEEGERLWPSLRNHESDRIQEMEKSINEYICNKPVSSKDHRVVQALAMLQKKDKKEVKIEYLDAVNKSWPEFWDFLEYADSNF